MDNPLGNSGAKLPALLFIYLTVLLDVLAMGIIGPVLPHLLRDFVGDTGQAAILAGHFATSWALMQLLASPMVGSLSDHFGRRPVVLLSNLGQGLDYLLMAVAPTLPWLFIGRLISGVTAASIATAGAYIADVTVKERRAAAFGWLGVALSLGFVIGPALGGILGSYHQRLPFWVAGCLCLSNAVYGYFILPESLPLSRRTQLSWRRVNPLGALHLLRTNPTVMRVGMVMFMASAAHQAVIHVTPLYTLHRYGWNAMDVGLQLAGLGLCGAIIQGGLLGYLTRRFTELQLLRTSLCLGAVGFCVCALAPMGWVFCCAAPLLAAWNAGGAVQQSLMSRHVGEDRQGQLQGAQSSVWGLAGVLAPSVFAATFAHNVKLAPAAGVPGAPFLLAGGLLVIAMLLTRQMPVDPQTDTKLRPTA
jgi:DHA1 family tetracycline resistance protein-like MFS transporter